MPKANQDVKPSFVYTFSVCVKVATIPEVKTLWFESRNAAQESRKNFRAVGVWCTVIDMLLFPEGENG